MIRRLAASAPREAGARTTISWPVGHLADYALELELGAAPLLIREFVDRYEAVLAGVALAERTLALVEANPTAALCLGGALVGAAVGTALTRKPDGAILGAGLGTVVALLVKAYLERPIVRAELENPQVLLMGR